MEIKFEVRWLLGENIIWLWDRVQGQTGPTFFFSVIYHLFLCWEEKVYV